MTNKTKDKIHHFIGGSRDVDSLSITTSNVTLLKWAAIDIGGSKIGVYRIVFWKNHDE